MTVSDQNQLIADWARDIVTQTAPAELPLFRVKSVEYFKNPDKSLNHVAYQTALGLQLPDEKAKLLANATVGSLAVAPS